LTLIPKNIESSISDLFYWKVNDEWETFFDLSPTIKLFKQSPPESIEKILIVIFDKKGTKIASKNFEFSSINRKTLKISEIFAAKINGEGTFAIFHYGRPDYLKKIGAYVAERGYLSFSYRGNIIRSYVHGNMDAVALQGKDSVQYLGNAFIWNREYRLQYLLGDSRKTKIVLVNTYRKKLNFTFRLLNADSKSDISSKTISIASGGVEIHDIPCTISEKIYLVIESKSIMARPLVIDYQTQGVNVFHG
jgi:hypothetical protein